MRFAPTSAIESVKPPESVIGQPAWLRLEDQLQWYDGRSQRAQRLYKRLKIAQITLAVFIPLLSLLPLPLSGARWSTAAAGALIALLEAIQQLNQYSTLWVTYRSTAEHLKHEKFLFLSGAGPYRGMSESDRLIQLSERVEEFVSTEHAKWLSERSQRTSDRTSTGNS